LYKIYRLYELELIDNDKTIKGSMRDLQ